MALMTELFSNSLTPCSGAWVSRAYLTIALNMSDQTMNNVSCASSGAFVGSAASLGVQQTVTSSLTYEPWLGLANTQDVGEPDNFTENHDQLNPTSDSDPNPLQGGNNVPVNPFPSSEVEEERPLQQRDATRYHKAYSFSRNQPVRVRIFRDR